LIKQKSKSPSAASRGKAVQREKFSAGVDHAGLRAERRNGGLALLGSDSDRHSCYKSKSASDFLVMLLPPCYPA